MEARKLWGEWRELLETSMLEVLLPVKAMLEADVQVYGQSARVVADEMVQKLEEILESLNVECTALQGTALDVGDKGKLAVVSMYIVNKLHVL